MIDTRTEEEKIRDKKLVEGLENSKPYKITGRHNPLKIEKTGKQKRRDRRKKQRKLK